MFTLLIQTSKTADCFQRFKPLFAESIEQGKVNTCLWVESGNSVETSLPSIKSLVSDKKSWRAIVVCPDPELELPDGGADSSNPFDYDENKEGPSASIEDGKYKDCKSPLIRLTHLLGGLPRMSFNYDTVTHGEDEDTNLPIRLGYAAHNPDGTKSQNDVFARWEEERLRELVLPSEIILIKSRRQPLKRNDSREAECAWTDDGGIREEGFAERNLYPSNCRFLTFDFDDRGPSRSEESYFRFWLAALLIATNKIPSDFIKPSRLYDVYPVISETQLRGSMQLVVNKLNFAKLTLRAEIKKEEESLADARNPIPDTRVTIPVAFEFSPDAAPTFDYKKLGLTGGIESSDFEVWGSFDKATRSEAKFMERQIERSLDYAAARAREETLFPKNEVLPLNEYQVQDLETKLVDTRIDIINDQSALPEAFDDIQPKLEEKSESIKDSMFSRVSFRDTLALFGVTAIAILGGLLPSVLGKIPLLPASLFAFATLLLITSVGFFVLWRQRKKLVLEIEEYHDTIRELIASLSNAAGRYSRFFSDVTTHMRGKSYLETMEATKAKKDGVSYSRRKHLSYIESFLENLNSWNRALQVGVDINSVDALESFVYSNQSINYEELYVFDSGKDFKVQINDSGTEIESPYGFIEMLKIEVEGV